MTWKESFLANWTCLAALALFLMGAIEAGGTALSANGAASGARSVAAVAQDAQTTVWSGIYTAAQAQRGQPLYQAACSYCHLDNLAGFGGDTVAAALTGARFFVRWRTETVGEMFKIISETMPQNGPGILSPQDYVDIMSYVFKVNGMPAGDNELPPDREKLERIVFTDKPRP